MKKPDSGKKALDDAVTLADLRLSIERASELLRYATEIMNLSDDECEKCLGLALAGLYDDSERRFLNNARTCYRVTRELKEIVR